MPLTSTLPCDVHHTADGVLVIPHLLPLHVPDTALTLTVAEWLGIHATCATP